jgi:hypothetical protein
MNHSKKILRKESTYNSIKKIKYIGTNLTKEMTDLCAENKQEIMKKIKGDTSKRKDISSL